MYVARHSWASIARQKNVPLSVISEGMGHDSENTTKIYLAQLDNSAIDRANAMILKMISEAAELQDAPRLAGSGAARKAANRHESAKAHEVADANEGGRAARKASVNSKQSSVNVER
jgi:hypothetical protein